MEWISVKDSLPDKNGLYLCCWKALCDANSWIVRIGDWRFEGWMNLYDEPYKEGLITHWMPLPEPPKGEEE